MPDSARQCTLVWGSSGRGCWGCRGTGPITDERMVETLDNVGAATESKRCSTATPQIDPKINPHAIPAVQIALSGLSYHRKICTSRKIILKKDNATLVHGNADSLPRTMSLTEVEVGGVPCKPGKWAYFTSAAGKDNLQRKDTHLRLGKIKHLLDTETASKRSGGVVGSPRVFFFSFLPPEFEANIESKHLNPLGELKGDFDDSCPKTGDQFTPGDVLPFFNFADFDFVQFDFLQQSLAERARSTHEIAGLKDQLSLMEQKYDTERSLCAAAVDKQRSIETKAKQELTDLKTKHAAEVASMDQQIKNLKKDVDRLTVSSESQNDDLLATQDNLSSALEDIKALKKTIANRERVLREYRKKITETKKTGSQAAHEVTEERDELLVEIEDANAQASHFKERGDRLAKELAAAKRATKKLQLKLDDPASSSCKGKRSRSDSEAQSEESVDQEETGGEESCDSSDVDDKFQSPPSCSHGGSGKKEKRDREKGGSSSKKKSSKRHKKRRSGKSA
eukprot:g30375.t1